MTEIRRLPIPRCLLAEGPIWDAAHNCLIVTDINGKKLHLLNWANQQAHPLSLPQKAGFAALCGDGLALGMEDGAYFLPEECLAGESVDMQVLSPLHAPQAIPGDRFNDGKPGPDGRLYGGTLCRDGHGKLLRIAYGQMETALAPVSISNGLAWTSDGRTLYYCDTYTHQVDALDFDKQTGELSSRRTAVDFHDLQGAPDGLCIDREGRLWVAVWGEGAVYRCDPETGEKNPRCRDPRSQSRQLHDLRGRKPRHACRHHRPGRGRGGLRLYLCPEAGRARNPSLHFHPKGASP